MKALFALGFRPFYLLAGFYAALADLRGFDSFLDSFAGTARRKRLMRLSVSARRGPEMAVVKTLVLVNA